MITPSRDYHRTYLVKPREIAKGLDGILDQALGAARGGDRLRRQVLSDAERIDRMSRHYQNLSDRRLRGRLQTLAEVFRRYPRPDDEVIARALAAIREAADRTLGMHPFPVQLAGALALYRGYLAEMATGEGKTLTAGLAGVLAGWSGRPCHIVTVNDYLAMRDSQWMAPLYTKCGLSTAHIAGPMPPAERQAAYNLDVTYCTGKELVADFLRDRLRLGRFQHATRREIRLLLNPALRDRLGLVLRGLHTAIVDEADSVMIDEAVTPVIISRPHDNEPLRSASRIAAGIANELEPAIHYTVNARYKEIELVPAGEDRIAASCDALPGLWRGPDRRRELVKLALSAKEFYHRDEQYVVQDDKVVIVDESTGRIMPQRTWREGLHQAVEAREDLAVSDPSETMARISFQRFFRLFARLSGMTGTAREAAGECWRVYHLPLVTIPTNRPCRRVELPDRVFSDLASKWDAVVEEIQRIHALKRPILVGTRSVKISEMLSGRLDQLDLDHRVLNAERHAEEAQIVAGAGGQGHITIATNMAGRGTDIKLGRRVAELGGLHVLATERHESRRIDRQLFGRSGRQGDPGSAQAFCSIEDDLLRRHCPAPMKRCLRQAALRPLAWSTARPLVLTAIAQAQQSAQRLARRQRHNVLRLDTWLEDAISFAGPDYR